SAGALVLGVNEWWELLQKRNVTWGGVEGVREDRPRRNTEQQGRIESSAADGALYEFFCTGRGCRRHSRRNTLRNIAVTLGIALVPLSAVAQKPAPPAPAQVAREVRDYRMANEERIVRELS